MTISPSPAGLLAQDSFTIEQRLRLFGRPIGLLIRGQWLDDGSCEATLGIIALEPMDMCRVIAAVRFEPETELQVVRVTEPDDARDDQGVLERHFGKPLPKILDALFTALRDAFAAAADLRDARAIEEHPICEMPAPAWLH